MGGTPKIALGGLALALSACAAPPYADFRGEPGLCTLVDRRGFMLDRPCTPFELAWLPGARRVHIYEEPPADRRFQELTGRYRWTNIREVRPGVFCRLTRDPAPLVTRDCRDSNGVVVSARG